MEIQIKIILMITKTVNSIIKDKYNYFISESAGNFELIVIYFCEILKCSCFEKKYLLKLASINV